MQLYLSSLSFDPESFSTFLGTNSRLGLIANALDFLPPKPRSEAVASTFNALSQLSDVTEIDLRRYFRDRSALAEVLSDLDALWLPGGSCFLLAAALSNSGAGALVTGRVRNNTLKYAGSSAGAVVASTDLRPATTCEDPSIVRQRYHYDPVFTGLGLLNASIIPHFIDAPSKDPSQDELPTHLMRDYCLENGIDFVTITDGSALIIDGVSTTEITFPPVSPLITA